MAATALEAITHFIEARHFREGETFSFASLEIRHPHKDDLRAALDAMQKDGFIEPAGDGVFAMTKAGYLHFFGEPPSEDETVKTIMSEIATRGLKPGKSFLWAPVEKSLELKGFRSGDLTPALDKILGNRWFEKAPLPGFYKLTEAGSNAVVQLTA